MLFPLIGVGSTAGRFILGTIADRMGRERSLLMMFVGMAASLAVWALSANVWSMAFFAFVYGVFYGGWVAVLPAVVTDYFGSRYVSGIIGVLYTSVAFGTLIGPSAAGFAFDLSHSYELPIIASAASNVLAALILALTPRAASLPLPLVLAADGRLEVPMAGTYPLSRALEAAEVLRGQHPGGKLALVPD